ncbi:MAG: diguanylate cyclase [Deltaproteobacteria bacterium]|nr:diguanylate cyclase [Deltaproteobacteria bacterium]
MRKSQRTFLKLLFCLFGLVLFSGLGFFAFTHRTADSLLPFGLWGGFLFVLYLVLFWRIFSFFRESRLKEETLERMSTRDLATGLMNRRGFEGLAGQEMERARRKGYPASLIFVRVEPLELITKDFGRPAVDHLLTQIAEFLKKACRSYDGVFAYDRDTFAVLLAETGSDQLKSVAGRIEKKMMQKEFSIGRSKDVIKPHIHYGLATYPAHGEDLKGVVSHALSGLFDASSPK